MGHYFRHAMAEHAFTRIDLAWWRVVRMLRTRHS
jgi:hypothetical protein